MAADPPDRHMKWHICIGKVTGNEIKNEIKVQKNIGMSVDIAVVNTAQK